MNRLAHVSGTRMFGSVDKNAEIAVGVTSIDSSVVKYVPIDAYLTTDTNTDLIINNSYLIVTTEIEADG